MVPVLSVLGAMHGVERVAHSLPTPLPLPYMGVGRVTIALMRVVGGVMNFLANLSPLACSRLWCFWVGGFEEIEYHFVKR